MNKHSLIFIQKTENNKWLYMYNRSRTEGVCYYEKKT